MIILNSNTIYAHATVGILPHYYVVIATGHHSFPVSCFTPSYYCLGVGLVSYSNRAVRNYTKAVIVIRVVLKICKLQIRILYLVEA